MSQPFVRLVEEAVTNEDSGDVVVNTVVVDFTEKAEVEALVGVEADDEVEEEDVEVSGTIVLEIVELVFFD